MMTPEQGRPPLRHPIADATRPGLSVVSSPDEEPALTTVASQQMRRLTARALSRPWLATSLALAISALLFAVQVRRPKLYEREVGLLITEGAFAADGRPRSRGELREFINRVVFTTSRLEELAIKHDLMRKFRAANRGIAVDRIRQNIAVGIWQDYFEDLRGGQDPPRSVRLTLGFSAPDPDTALAVARDLGQLVAETQTQREVELAVERVKSKRVLAESAAARAAVVREEFERMKVDAITQPGGNAYVSLQRMRAAVQAADAASAAMAGDLIDAQLRERGVRRLGHLVQTVDPGIPLWKKLSRAEMVAAQGGLALGVGLLLAVLLVGAFDPTIRDEQDLRRVRINHLATLPVSSAPTPGERHKVA